MIIAIIADRNLIGNETHEKRTINARVCLGKGEDMWESPINVMEIQDSFVSEIKEKMRILS